MVKEETFTLRTTCFVQSFHLRGKELLTEDRVERHRGARRGRQDVLTKHLVPDSCQFNVEGPQIKPLDSVGVNL